MLSPEPGESGRQTNERAEARLRDTVKSATYEYVAQTIGDPTWKIVAQCWTTRAAGAADAAAIVAGFESEVHNILLNRPAQLLSASVGVPTPEVHMIGGIVGAIELPIDRSMDTLTRTIQIGGIVLGAVSGQPVLFSACLKSLAHDELIKGLAAVMEKTVSERGLSHTGQRSVAEPAVAQRETRERKAEKSTERKREARRRLATEWEASARSVDERQPFEHPDAGAHLAPWVHEPYRLRERDDREAGG